MKSYTHKGVVKTNGFVDTSKLITDASHLKVSPEDDGHKLVTSEIGNFEWWYFDVIDVKNSCILKLIVHLGTDPLRRKFFPQLAVTIITPAKKETFLKLYSLGDFTASKDHCDVKLGNNFHALVESSREHSLYHVIVNINEFKADITFIVEIDGWKPLGDKVNMEIGRKKGTFFWVIPAPKAKVVGELTVSKEKYKLEEAYGYHDHNYWEVDVKRKLFMDEIISKWYWGRFLTKDYAVIFMKTFFRKHSIRSLMIAKGNRIFHSSNNLISISEDNFKKDAEIQTLYPTQLTVRSTEKNNLFTMKLDSKEVIEKRDLLEGINPFIGYLIKAFVSRPSYYGILAESTANIATEEIQGIAMYELMTFRGR